jgi:hypothetical protein
LPWRCTPDYLFDVLVLVLLFPNTTPKMHHLAVSTAFVGLLAGLTTAQNKDWQQCGGQNWTGDTTCLSGTDIETQLRKNND